MRKNPNVTAVHLIQAGKYRRYHNSPRLERLLDVKTNMLNIRDAFRVIQGTLGAYRVLSRVKPDIIFFKGGYVVVPLGIVARQLGIPYVTHDSDVIPGLANRLIAKGAHYHAVAHSEIHTYPKAKTVVTGIPIQNEYSLKRGVSSLSAKRQLGRKPTDMVLFVYCGTQGARVIDMALKTHVQELLTKHPNLHIYHVFGRLNEAGMNEQYKHLSNGLRARVHTLAFVPNAYDYIAASDVVLARAGATTLAELATIGRATIVIPAEQLTGGHQVKNAQKYAELGAVVMVRENDISHKLVPVIEQLLKSDKKRQKLIKALMQTTTPDAARKIAELLIDTVTHKNRAQHV